MAALARSRWSENRHAKRGDLIATGLPEVSTIGDGDLCVKFMSGLKELFCR